MNCETQKAINNEDTDDVESFLREVQDDSLKETKVFLVRQLYASFSCFLQGASVGCAYGMSSILLPQLKESKEIILDNEQESWIASIPTLIMIPAVLTSGPCLEKMGRRLSLLLITVLTACSWTALYFSQSFLTLFLARALSGIYLAQSFPMMLTYIGEVVKPSIRGTCLGGLPLGASFGVLAMQLLGFYFSWRTICLAVLIIPTHNLFAFIYLKESHIWCINEGLHAEAKCAFRWFRGSSAEAQKEIAASLAKNALAWNANFIEKVRYCFSRQFMMPFGVTTLLYVTAKFSGDIAIIFYTSNIIRTVTDDSGVRYYSTLLLNTLRFIGTGFSCILLKRVSPRKLWICGGYCLVFTLFTLSLLSYLARVHPETVPLSYVCLALIVLDVSIYSLGFAALPSVFCGQLYPTKVRGIGTGLSSFMYCCSVFFIIKTMPYLMLHSELSVIFLIFGTCTFTGVTISCFVLPDTRHKTLTELERIYD